ncbi:hypothetical protein JCM10213_002445 [Rhodosporidiobolus nylandii]
MPASSVAAYGALGAPASPHKREQRTPPSGAHSSSEGPEQVVKDAAFPRPFPSPSPCPSDEPPSPSAARKRSTADTSGAISDHSDLSELSSVEESGSEGSEVETEDGDEEGKQGDDGHKRAGGVTITSAADLPVTDLWPKAANEALVRGLELIPNIVALLIKGSPAPLSSYRHRDWDAFLGPDLHPHTVMEPKKQKKGKTRSTSSSKPKKRKREGQLAASPVPQPPKLPSSPAFPSFFPFYAYSRSADSVPTPQQPAALSDPHEQPLPPQHLLLPASSFSHAQPSSSTSSFLSTSDLSAFFTSFCPAHSFASSAAALHTSGLRTPGDLLRLMDLERETLAAVLDELAAEGKVCVLEKAWLKRAVYEGRKALAGGM